MVSAFAAHQRLVLGQVKVAEKSNEIIAIPKLLDMLAIEGVSGGEDPRIHGAGIGDLASVCGDDAAVLVAVQHASRRLLRCLTGMLDRRCARRAERNAVT